MYNGQEPFGKGTDGREIIRGGFAFRRFRRLFRGGRREEGSERVKVGGKEAVDAGDFAGRLEFGEDSGLIRRV